MLRFCMTAEPSPSGQGTDPVLSWPSGLVERPESYVLARLAPGGLDTLSFPPMGGSYRDSAPQSWACYAPPPWSSASFPWALARPQWHSIQSPVASTWRIRRAIPYSSCS